MKQVSIRPVWTIQDADASALPPRLIELLVQVAQEGSLLLAARQMGLSYRHAWDLVRQGEQQFKQALLRMERGKGSSLTPLGERIVWADRRIHARLRPVLESLASELAEELRAALSAVPTALRLHASHGFAVERLIARLAEVGLELAFSYADGAAALAALREGECDVAGLHVPFGPAQAVALAHYRRWFEGLDLILIDIATRRQGLMVRPGNPREIFALDDLVRPGLRFINRQPGSGTRLLLETLLKARGLDPAAIAGFEQGEYTHAAVAAFVASGMADVGFGLEPPARHFKLDFVPVASERYFLLCRAELEATPALQTLLGVLRDPDFQAALRELPGYDPSGIGRVSPLGEAFGPACDGAGG